MNMIFLKGNLTKDNEVRSTVKDKLYTSGTIAVNDEDKTKDPVFLPFTKWGDYPGKKGDSVFMYGKVRQFKDKDTGRPITTVDCEELVIKGKKIASPETIKAELDHSKEPVNDDEIPFS